MVTMHIYVDKTPDGRYEVSTRKMQGAISLGKSINVIGSTRVANAAVTEARKLAKTYLKRDKIFSVIWVNGCGKTKNGKFALRDDGKFYKED